MSAVKPEIEKDMFAGFLQRQHEEGLDLARWSDLVQVFPVDGPQSQRFLVEFRCKGLAERRGEIVEASQFGVGIRFPADYLRRADPFEVVTWLGPFDAFHPNIGLTPFGWAICIGRLAPGTPLVDILYQVFEIITYNKVTMREDDALNKAACVWAREHQDRFPVDRRPLKRRELDLQVNPLEEVAQT